MTTDTKGLLAPEIDEPTTGATVKNTVRLKGTGTPGATVQVRTVVEPDEESKLVLTTLVLPDKSWAGNALYDLPEGINTILALQVLPNGVSSPASRNRKFTVK